MRTKIKMLPVLISGLFLCSCELQNENIETETENFSTTLPSSTVTSGITEENTKNIQSTDASSGTFTESIETEITISAAPVYDKTTPPVLTVSNIDHKTNDMSWTAVEGAQAYMLYILNEQTGEFEEYGEIEDTTCYDIDLEPNRKYTYKVAAEFPDGSKGDMSEQVEIYTYNYIGKTSVNGGCMDYAQQGEWVYFVGEDDHIFKIRSDGSSFSEICSDDAWCINILGEYIYYLCYDEKKDQYIYRIKQNGTDNQKLISANDLGKTFLGYDMVTKIIAAGERIYFVLMSAGFEYSSNYSLYSAKTDGTDVRYEFNGHRCNLNILGIYDDTLYTGYNSDELKDDGYSGFYLYENDEYIIKTFCGDRESEVIIPVRCAVPYYFNGSTFIFKAEDKNIYSYDISSEVLKCIGANVNSDKAVVREDIIYFSDKDTNDLMKMDISNGNIEKIAEGFTPAALIDDYIWLLGNGDKKEIYRMDSNDNIFHI